jgi:hypothetical protein
MPSYVKFQSFVENEAEKVYNLGSDTLKIALTNSAPNAATNTVLADITQISGTNGYTTGGASVTVTTSAQSGGTYTLAANQVVFTASGGSMATFQYYVLYDSTATNSELIAYWDHGSAVTLANGETFTIKFNGANPGTIFTKS